MAESRIQAMSMNELLFHMRTRKRRKSTLPPGELKRRQAIRWAEFMQRSDARAKNRRNV